MLRDVNGNPVTDWQASLTEMADASTQDTSFGEIGNGVYSATAAATANAVAVKAADGMTTLFRISYPAKPQ